MNVEDEQTILERMRVPTLLLLKATRTILDEQTGKITLRHLFYRLVGAGALDKTEAAYGNMLAHLARWRRQKLVNWEAFADASRWYHRVTTFDGIQDALEQTAATYRRDFWFTQPYYPELWVEKDAITSIVWPIAEGFGVPLLPCRGFNSLSTQYAAARTFTVAQVAGQQPVILYLADHDPSVYTAVESATKTLRDDFDCEVEVRLLAVRPEQIDQWELPTRPTKDSTHARGWTDDSVELDAIAPERLQQLVSDGITDLIDWKLWAKMERREKKEQATLRKIVADLD